MAGCGAGVPALGPGDDARLTARLTLGLALYPVADALAVVGAAG